MTINCHKHLHESSASGFQLRKGTFWIFSSELLIIPSGLITAAFLTRQLGPDGYGLLTLTALFVAWIQWSVGSIFSRATIKFVGDAQNWRNVAAAVLNLSLFASFIAMSLVWLTAPLVARLFNEPILSSYIRLYSIDIPIFCLAITYRNILVGLGYFKKRAFASMLRWIARPLLVISLVLLGFSIEGALIGIIGSSVIELASHLYHVRLFPFEPTTFSMKKFFGYSAPLFLFAISMRLYDRLDIFSLKALGASTHLAGIYGASQNLALLPAIFAMAFAPVVLSTITRLLRAEQETTAKRVGKNTMRFVIGLMPFVVMISLTSAEIVRLVFGPMYLEAAGLFSILIFGAWAMLMICVTTAILTAAGKPGLTFILAGPLVPLGIIGHLIFIPRYGALGAAMVTSVCATITAVASIIAVYRLWRIAPSKMTLSRAFLVCGIVFIFCKTWIVYSYWLILKLLLISIAIVISYVLLGELHPTEILVGGGFLNLQKTAESKDQVSILPE